MSHTKIIETKGLTKHFGSVKALHSLDLNVEKNSIYGFLGPNGAGKTTTIKLLLGLIKPTSGSVKIFDEDLQTSSMAIKERIGYLPQNPRFYDYMTAREILEFTVKFYFTGPKELIDDRIDNLLDLVSLDKKADRQIKGFSGGERQRLGIAQAMVNYPDLLILDEPAAALDPIGRRDVLNIMSALKDHTTIFFSTHILDDVQRISDRVAILNHGKLIAEGNISDMLVGKDGSNFEITLKGDADAAYKRLSSFDWITDIEINKENGTYNWVVKTDDEQKAEKHLLRQLLKDDKLIVTRFNKKLFELEEVFMDIVEAN